MKKTSKILVALLFVAIILTACGPKNVWDDAIYKEDAELGQGSTMFVVLVEVMENKVAFEVATNKTNLADALLEIGLIDGEMGPYGLYIKTVNGMRADYEKDGAYWSLYIRTEAAETGASEVTVQDGEVYRFIYTK